MDRKQHRIINFVLLGLIFLFVCNVLTGCLLLPWNRKEFKKPLLKSIYKDDEKIVTIILDKNNKVKKIGQIYEIEIYYIEDISELIENENEIIIKQDVSDYVEKLYENQPYKIQIKWFGGHLFLKTIYQNGQFIVLDEHYTNGI